MNDAARMILELPDDAHVPVGLVREAFGVGRMVPSDDELTIRHMVRLCTEDLRHSESEAPTE